MLALIGGALGGIFGGIGGAITSAEESRREAKLRRNIQRAGQQAGAEARQQLFQSLGSPQFQSQQNFIAGLFGYQPQNPLEQLGPAFSGGGFFSAKAPEGTIPKGSAATNIGRQIQQSLAAIREIETGVNAKGKSSKAAQRAQGFLSAKGVGDFGVDLGKKIAGLGASLGEKFGGFDFPGAGLFGGGGGGKSKAQKLTERAGNIENLYKAFENLTGEERFKAMQQFGGFGLSDLAKAGGPATAEASAGGIPGVSSGGSVASAALNPLAADIQVGLRQAFANRGLRGTAPFLGEAIGAGVSQFQTQLGLLGGQVGAAFLPTQQFGALQEAAFGRVAPGLSPALYQAQSPLAGAARGGVAGYGATAGSTGSLDASLLAGLL